MSRDGFFGKQYGCNPCVASARDPKWPDIVAAELVLAGRTGNFIKGATHYFAPGAQNQLYREGRVSKDAATVYDTWTRGGDLLTWVGYVPGIDIRRQFFFRREPNSATGRARNLAMREPGRAALTAPMPVGILNPAQCSQFAPTIGVIGVGLLVAAGVSFFLISRPALTAGAPG